MIDDSKVEINSSSDALDLIVRPVQSRTRIEIDAEVYSWLKNKEAVWKSEGYKDLKEYLIAKVGVKGYNRIKVNAGRCKTAKPNVGEAHPETSGGDKLLPYGDQEQTNNTGIPYKSPEVYSSPTIWDSNIYPVPLFHQILLAHELTLRRASNDMRKLESSLSAAMVDLNPHQIDAALFAFKGPMSTGALLCDEVGLGKTIEAGLIISQLWAEGRRRIIAVVPATIRKQWQNELLEKFGIPCVIVDGFEYRQAKRSGMKTLLTGENW